MFKGVDNYCFWSAFLYTACIFFGGRRGKTFFKPFPIIFVNGIALTEIVQLVCQMLPC